MTTQSIRHAHDTLAHLHQIGARWFAAIDELRTRTALRRSLGRISDRQLQDAGLIRNDIDAACANDLSHSASSALRTARRRSGNW